MKNKILVISIFLILSSCLVHKGEINDRKCRPKNPKFELLKIPFKKSENLTFNKIYTLDDLEKMGIGFFEDGRIIIVKNYNYSKQNYDLITPLFMKSKNWNDPENIGDLRFENDILKTEYFSCSNSGDYIKRFARIVGDTLFFEKIAARGRLKEKNVSINIFYLT